MNNSFYLQQNNVLTLLTKKLEDRSKILQRYKTIINNIITIEDFKLNKPELIRVLTITDDEVNQACQAIKTLTFQNQDMQEQMINFENNLKRSESRSHNFEKSFHDQSKKLDGLRYNFSETKAINDKKTIENKDLIERVNYYEKKLDEKLYHIEKVENAFVDLEKNFEMKVSDIEVLGEHIKVLNKELSNYKNNPCQCNQVITYNKGDVSFSNEEDNKNVNSKLYKGYNEDINKVDIVKDNRNNKYSNSGYNNISNNNNNNNNKEELSGKEIIDLMNERKANKKAIDQKIKEKLIVEDSDYSVQMN